MPDNPPFMSDPQFEPAVRGARSALEFLAANPGLNLDAQARMVAAAVLVAFASDPGRIGPPLTITERIRRRFRRRP